MSVVFSSYTNDKNNKNGYFRIGNVTLNIPPVDIITDRIVNNDRKATLRGKNEMFNKSGQSRWDVTISWVSLIDDTAANPYKQWEDLQTIIAMFKAAPFVEVENKHLRQIFAEKDVIMAASRLAFGLRQLKVETHPDIVDGLIATLTMTYFNYLPYSLDFGYIGDNSQSTDAYKSSLFASYLNKWKSNNLVNKDDYFHTQDWKDQLLKEQGKVALNWKRYKAIIAKPKGDSSQATNMSLANPTSVNLTVNTAVAQKSTQELTADNLAKINTLNPEVAAAATAWLTAVAKAGPFKATVTSARRRTLRTDPGPGQSQQELYENYLNQGGQANLHKPGGPKYLVAAYKGYVYPNGSVAKGSQHESGNAIDITWSSDAAFQAAYNLSSQYGFSWSYKNNDKVHWDYTGKKSTVAAPTPIISASTVANKAGTQVPQSLGDLTDIGPEIQALINEGWIFDYITEDTAYFFKPESVILRDKQHEHLPHAIGLHPMQLSVLFVNNLAQIPLANYQYPTYQHIGPASSLLAIQITSVGTPDSNGEPVHSGLSDLTSMAHSLEEQFMQLRTNFRSVKSIHGMQAIFVENAVLNMLGIFGILNEQISTEIIKDSANMVQVSFMAHQYENMYEETPAYKINGITGSYIKTTQDIIGSGSLNTLSTNEQSQLTEIMEFQNDYDNLNSAALGKWILKAATLDTNGDFISKFSNNPVIPLPAKSINDIVITSKQTNGSQNYPCLNNRLPSMQASGQITFADYLAFSEVPAIKVSLDFDHVVDVAEKTVTNKLTSIQSMYAEVLVYVTSADPLFASQLQKLVNSPIYKKKYQDGVSADDPSKVNIGHGAYKDLGIGDIITPATYFVDNQEEYKAQLLQVLPSLVGSVSNNSNNIQGLNNTNSVSSTSTTGIPTDPNKLIQMLNIPGYSMKEAFPTFKLFFLEDANAGIYYAFDNFYSYSSVLEMEIVRAYDKPATAIIRITNLSNLFDHKLFDDTLVGRHEAKLARFTSPLDTTNELTTNTQQSSLIVGKNPITGTIDTRDLREGMDPANPKLIPLKYFPLQTGTKIQIRFGFENDPDKLQVVFNGSVTEIQEGDLGELVVTAQSFLLELTTVSGVVATNSSWDLGGFAGFGTAAPAYGGIGIFKDDGSAQTVIKQLLSNPAARHFGHWQLNGATPDRLLKGFNGWQALSGEVATILGYTNIAAIINNAYDRSGENIMVNNYVDYNGGINEGNGSRSFKDQQNQHIEGLLTGAQYFVDNTLDMSIWELIRDVSRRYPEYLLLEKFYGFPYEANSTMVFGSPLDWYYTRPALIGDDEIIRAATNNTALYKEWYQRQGRQAFLNAYDQFVVNQLGFFGALGFVTQGVFGNILDPVDRGYYISGEKGVNNTRPGEHNSTNAAGAFADQAAVSFSALKEVDDNIISLFEDGTLNIGQAASNVKLARAAFAAVEKSYIVYASQRTPTSGPNDDRIKPIRKYHFIDHQSIVHSGIKLNDKIYNTVKIVVDGRDSGIVKANSNIPEHHCRLLDVTKRLNDPAKNIADQGGDLYKLIGQSFLKEEIGKMYRGEIILRGIPEIEPMDILIMLDPSTGIVGPVEVDQVIHSFTQEMGYVTIVKPRCLVVINERTGAALGRQLAIAMATTINALSGNSQNSSVSLTSIAQAANNAGGGINAIGAGNPLSGLLSVVFSGAFSYWAESNFANNPIVIQPLFRFNRPWIGGLEGFEITGLTGTFSNAFEQLKADEIYPLIDLYKLKNKIT